MTPLNVESLARRTIQSLEYGNTLEERLWLEVSTLTARINTFGAKAKSIISSEPHPSRQSIVAARSLMRNLGEEISCFTLSLVALRGEYDDWLQKHRRLAQFLLTSGDAPLLITTRNLGELRRQASAATQKTAKLKEAIAGSVNQLRTAAAATIGIDELQIVLSACIQEHLQLLALIRQEGEFLKRLDTTLDLLLRRSWAGKALEGRLWGGQR